MPMATVKRKYRVLVAGSGDRVFDFISELLPPGGFEPILRAGDAGEVRRMLLDTPVDIVIINTPLSDDFGVELALDLAEGTTGVVVNISAYNLLAFPCAAGGAGHNGGREAVAPSNTFHELLRRRLCDFVRVTKSVSNGSGVAGRLFLIALSVDIQ